MLLQPRSATAEVVTTVGSEGKGGRETDIIGTCLNLPIDLICFVLNRQVLDDAYTFSLPRVSHFQSDTHFALTHERQYQCGAKCRQERSDPKAGRRATKFRGVVLFRFRL